MVGPPASLDHRVDGVDGVGVKLVDDQAHTITDVVVGADLAALFAYSRTWTAELKAERGVDLSFSSMLAAMVGDDQPLCRWLMGFFDRLGVKGSDITKDRVYRRPVLPAGPSGPPQLVTTYSFRQAWVKAREVRDLTSPGQPVCTRHFMAAYAASPAYHLGDFRKHRIDRREWCLELVDELSLRFPAEAIGWTRYAAMAPPLTPFVFDNDSSVGRDRMHLKREVESITRLIALRSTSTPLAIAVFGAWGSGKSFFLNRVYEGVAELAAEGAAATAGSTSEFHSRIAQVQFNAWHYSENALVPSLVAHIFRNLRVDAVDDDEQELQRRGAALLLQVKEKDEALATAGARYEAAKAQHAQAADDLARLQRELPSTLRSAQQDVLQRRVDEQRAAGELQRVQERRDGELRHAERAARVSAVLAASAGDDTTGAINSTITEVVGLANDVRTLRTRWAPIALGAVVLVVGFALAAVAQSDAWRWVLGAVSAVGAFAALARQWLAKLRRMSDIGESVDAATAKAVADSTARVNEKFADEIAAARAALASTAEARAAAEEKLRNLSDADASSEVAARERDVEAAHDEVLRAQGELDDSRTALDRLSVDDLLAEFLDDQATAGKYESELGVLSQVRNDFERLSRLIARATADHAAGRGPEPTVSRIVLYIDDLDRCEEKRVVEVIRAVHLLLAFPLFVCVVAADPRWLTQCLENAPGIHAPESIRGDDQAFVAQFGRVADPADYIEKIFQLPIWLRPIPVERRAGLLRSWLEPADGADGQAGAVTGEELDFLSDLAEHLDGKPRTLKRLANTYRLVKAGLSDVALETFLVDDLAPDAPNGDGRRHLPYRTCLTLLTVLCGNRDEAVCLAESLDATEVATVAAWVGELERQSPELAEFLKTSLAHAQLDDLVELKSWFERTRRYSFYL
jgi:hypothetical protein